MNSLLTVPIRFSSLQKCEDLILNLPSEVRAYEVWLDHLKPSERDPALIEAACRSWKKISKKKLVVVCKDLSEGGNFVGRASEKVQLLLSATRGDADYIDIGLQTGKSSLLKVIENKRTSKVIVSFHDFEKTPSQKRLDTIIERIRLLGADVIKIACLVRDPGEAERLMEMARALKKLKRAHIVLGMGPLGVITRVFSTQMGNELNFVSIEKKSAPGQLSLDQMMAFRKVLS